MQVLSVENIRYDHPYLDCVTEVTCPGQRIPAEKLESAVLDHMANRLFTKERVKKILKNVYSELREMDKQKDGLRKSLNKKIVDIKRRMARQYEAIESGDVDLKDVGERIRELKTERQRIEERLEAYKQNRVIPLHYFTDESIEGFQRNIKSIFLVGQKREMVKGLLRLFIDRIVIERVCVRIIGKTGMLLALFEQKTAAKTDILTADDFWLPSTDSNRGPDG